MTRRADWTVLLGIGALIVLAAAIHVAPLLVFRPAPASNPEPGTSPGPAASDGPFVIGPTANPNPANPGLPNPNLGPANAPPAFVTNGARLTWYGAGASVAQSRFAWVEEPCTGQNWMDRKSGKCYRRTDESGEGQPGAAGDGLSQIDVIAVDGQNAVLSATLYTFFREKGTLIVAPLGGASVNAVNLDGSWVNPAQLAQLERDGLGDLLVLSGAYRLGMDTYDAVSFVSGLGTPSYSSYTYDLNSGLLLAANTSSGGVTSPIRAEGEDPPVGNSQLSLVRFAGYRQRTLPGLAAPGKPDWVAQTSRLTYQGMYHFANPVDPASGSLSHPTEIAISFGQGGANWSTYVAQSVVPNLGMQSQAQGIAGPTGPYWYDPQALSAMTAGQVLDQDGLTGEQVVVSSLGQGANGKPVVVIDQQLPGNFVRSTYEQQTGMLVALDVQTANAGTTVSVQLVDRR